MSRFTSDIPIVYATPFRPLFTDFSDKRTPTLIETITAIENVGCIPDVRRMAEATLNSARDRKTAGDLHDDPLPVDSVAALMKYCTEDTIPPFHSELTARCCRENRTYVRPFLPFLWLLAKTLEMLEPYKGKMVHRGVKEALGEQYPKGRKFVWHAPVSTTKSISALSKPSFLGEAGDRTIFAIELTQNSARDISRYSSLEDGEVLLPPGCRFEVTAVLSPAPGVTAIQLVELPSDHLILNCGQIPVAAAQKESAFSGKEVVQQKAAFDGKRAAEKEFALDGKAAAQKESALSGKEVAQQESDFDGKRAAEKEFAFDGKAAAQEESALDGNAVAQGEPALDGKAAAQKDSDLDGVFTINNHLFQGPLVASASTDYTGDKKVYVKTFSKLVHPDQDKWKFCKRADGTYTIESIRFAAPLVGSVIVDIDGDNEVYVKGLIQGSRPLSGQEKWKLSQLVDGTYTIANCKFAGSLIASANVDSYGDNMIYIKRSVLHRPGQEKWIIEKADDSDPQSSGYRHS